jgi:DNA-binding protein HU-beta
MSFVSIDTGVGSTAIGMLRGEESLDTTGVAANRASADIIGAIVNALKTEGGFALPSFGTFTVKKTKARKGLNPRAGEPVKVKVGKTVRFKASPALKKPV